MRRVGSFNEIAAFHLDRLLGFNLLPPSAIVALPRSLLPTNFLERFTHAQAKVLFKKLENRERSLLGSAVLLYEGASEFKFDKFLLNVSE